MKSRKATEEETWKWELGKAGPRFDGDNADFLSSFHESPRQAHPLLGGEMQIAQEFKK